MVEGRLCSFRRAIFLHQIKPRQWHIQTRAFRILQQHELCITVALVNLLQSLVLPNTMLDVNHVVANLEIPEVGKKCRGLGFVPLRARGHRVRLIEEIARTQDGQVGVGKRDTIWNIRLRQRRREQFTREIRSFVGVALSASGAAAQAERNCILAENVGQALDFASIWDSNQDSLTLRDLPLYFFQHRGNRTVKTWCGLRLKGDCRCRAIFAARDFKMLDVSSR